VHIVALQQCNRLISSYCKKQIGHSCSMPVVRSSLPMRRAAILPSPIRRRIIRSSHEQLQYSIYYEEMTIKKMEVVS